MPHDTGAFGALLQRYRQAAVLSQEALAERAQLSVQAISQLERGLRRQPRLETVHLLAQALNLTEAERATLLTAARPSGRAPGPLAEGLPTGTLTFLLT